MKFRQMERGGWNSELGPWNLELGSWNLEVGIWSSEFGMLIYVVKGAVLVL